MGALEWSPSPDRNATADPTLAAADGTSARELPSSLRGVMAGVAALAADRGGGLTTAGTGNAYTVATATGIRRLRDGIALLLKIDHANTDAPFLEVDGTGPRPWLDRAGNPLRSGTLQPRLYLWCVWSSDFGGWVSDIASGLTVGLFDTAMRAWWLSLPTDPRGIGPNAPWRNNGTVAWTGVDNPAFTIDSPEGRRLTLTLIKEALPTAPDGLNPGDPWLNGDTIAFVPVS
ncbi:hypothetical protein [Methylobacterium sp. JK268]